VRDFHVALEDPTVKAAQGAAQPLDRFVTQILGEMPVWRVLWDN